MKKFWAAVICLFLSAQPAFSTVVLWDGRDLVCDSQISTFSYNPLTHQYEFTGKKYGFKKIRIVKNWYVGVAGDVSDINKFLNWLKTGQGFPSGGKFHALVCTQHGAYFYDGMTNSMRQVHAPFGIGCGAELGLKFMNMGFTAREAVEMVEGIDPYCGGPIFTVPYSE